MRSTIADMYSVISTFQQTIVGSISPEEVSEYDWLRQNVGQVDTGLYQQRYRNFWAMNVAQLSSSFYMGISNF